MGGVPKGVWLASAVALGALLLPGAGSADHTMSGSVGPGFDISLTGTAGIQPGTTHQVAVNDQADIHSFHLSGPNGDIVATSIGGTGLTTVSAQFVAGTYTYVCDAHPSSMRGSFSVGSPPPAPPPPPAAKPVRLNGAVGPGAKIDLKTVAGKRVLTLRAGVYLFVVSDRTALDNFHLTGPGVNRKTAVKGKGTFRWTLRLKPGKHRYRSDEHPRLSRAFTVRKAA